MSTPTPLILANKNHKEIVTNLIKLVLQRTEGDVSRPAWTKAVKAVMKELALNYMAECVEYCGTLENKTSREWLVDVAWYYKTKDEEGISLALESEWDKQPHSHGVDFSKLLALKAPLKIMLFSSHHMALGVFEDKQRVCIDAFEDILRKWVQHTKGDLIYTIDFSGGHHTTWFTEILSDGRISDLALKKMTDLSGEDKL